MASLINRPNDNRWIQYTIGLERYTLRLGKRSKRDAMPFKTNVEKILNSRFAGLEIEPSVAKWLGQVAINEPKIYARMVKLGLAEETSDHASQRVPTIAKFIREYIEKRTGARDSKTIRNYKLAERSIIEFFGTAKRLDDVTKDDANDYRLFLESKRYKENTINRRIGRAKQFFASAVDAKLIGTNPFHGQSTKVRAVESNFHRITPSDIEKILDVVPNSEWRLAIALGYYAGLRRCEIPTFRWDWVNWSESKIEIDSPKTGKRWIPIFKELEPYLSARFDDAEPGDVLAMPRFNGNQDANLNTQLYRYCKQAGVERWREGFQQMRRNAEINLCQTFPQHVVCRWIGHTQTVANEFYLRTTDEHFEMASKKSDQTRSTICSDDQKKSQNPKHSDASSEVAKVQNRQKKELKPEEYPLFPEFFEEEKYPVGESNRQPKNRAFTGQLV